MWNVYYKYDDGELELIYNNESEKIARQVMHSMVMNGQCEDENVHVEFKEGHYKLNSYKYVPLTRSNYESIFDRLLKELNLNARLELWDMSIDNYKKYVKVGISGEGEKYDYIETDKFILMPYYWGDDDEIINLPNFEFKDYEFKLQFYKYALRGITMNQGITYDEFEEMIDICIKNLKEDN